MATSKTVQAGSVSVTESSGSLIINTPVVNIYINSDQPTAAVFAALTRLEGALMTMKDSLDKLAATESKLEDDFRAEEEREAAQDAADAEKIAALTAQRDDLQAKLDAATAANDPAAVDAITAKLAALDSQIAAVQSGGGSGSVGSGTTGSTPAAGSGSDTGAASDTGSTVTGNTAAAASGPDSTAITSDNVNPAPVEPLATEPVTPAGIEPEVGSPIALGETSLTPNAPDADTAPPPDEPLVNQ